MSRGKHYEAEFTRTGNQSTLTETMPVFTLFCYILLNASAVQDRKGEVEIQLIRALCAIVVSKQCPFERRYSVTIRYAAIWAYKSRIIESLEGITNQKINLKPHILNSTENYEPRTYDHQKLHVGISHPVISFESSIWPGTPEATYPRYDPPMKFYEITALRHALSSRKCYRPYQQRACQPLSTSQY